MKMSASRPTVDALLDRAGEFAAEGNLTHADSFFLAAIAADTGPVATLRYGAHLLRLGELDEAWTVCQRGWELAKFDQTLAAQALACRLLSEIAHERRDSLVAQQYQQLAIAAELNVVESDLDASLSVDLRMSQVRAWTDAGEFEAASRLLTSCVSDDDANTAEAVLQQGHLTARQGKDEAAIALYRRAHEFFRDRDDLDGAGRSMEALGYALYRVGAWPEAREALHLANRIAHQLGQRHRARQIAPNLLKLEQALARLSADPQLN